MAETVFSRAVAIWKKMSSREYRESFSNAQTDNTLAMQIYNMRQARGWSRAELADKINRKEHNIEAMEDPNTRSGSYELEELQSIAAAFDVGLLVRFVPFSTIVGNAVRPDKYSQDVLSYDADHWQNMLRENR